MPALGDSASSLSSSGLSVVWVTPELRYLVLALLDKATLATLLRVEKGATAAVASLLYKEVTEEQAGRMDRDSDRRAACCDAVQIINRNPPSLDPLAEDDEDDTHVPVRFSAINLSSDLAAWRTTFPNLRTVLADRPSHEADDVYTVHCEGDKTRLELETRVGLDIYTHPDPLAIPPALPSVPVLAGVEVHHVISLKLEDGGEEELWGSTERDEALNKWKEWLYRKPLDPRVVNVDHYSVANMPFTYRDAATFIANRAAAGHEPLRSVHVPSDLPYRDPEYSVFMIDRMSPHIRKLYITLPLFNELLERAAIPLFILTALLANLEYLDLVDFFYHDFPFVTSIPLIGFPKLRELRLYCVPDGLSWEALAAYVCQLGSEDCIYRLMDENLKEIGGKEFQELATLAKL